MTAVIALLVFALVTALVGILVRLTQIVEELRQLNKGTFRVQDEVRDLRLKARTRLSNVTRTHLEGPTDATEDLAELRRLGRDTKSRRTLVGGDEGSQQHERVRRSTLVTKKKGGAYDDDDE